MPVRDGSGPMHGVAIDEKYLKKKKLVIFNSISILFYSYSAKTIQLSQGACLYLYVLQNTAGIHKDDLNCLNSHLNRKNGRDCIMHSMGWGER